jgi:hypothetical protein
MIEDQIIDVSWDGAGMQNDREMMLKEGTEEDREGKEDTSTGRRYSKRVEYKRETK